MDSQKVTDPLNRGMVGGLLGMPADMLNMLRNGGRSVGNLANRLAGVNAPPAPMVENPVYGQEWWGDKMQQAGYVSPNRNKLAEFGAGLLDPGSVMTDTPMLAKGLFGLGDPATLSAAGGLLGHMKLSKLFPPKQSSPSHARDLAEEVSRIQREWESSGAPAEIFKAMEKHPNAASFFDEDGDLTDMGTSAYQALFNKAAEAEAARFVPTPKRFDKTDPLHAVKYAQELMDRQGIPYDHASSGSSFSQYLTGNGQKLRVSNHVLPDHYPNDADFQFGDFPGGETDTAKLRAWVRSLKK